jgi:hypothetical protein
MFIMTLINSNVVETYATLAEVWNRSLELDRANGWIVPFIVEDENGNEVVIDFDATEPTLYVDDPNDGRFDDVDDPICGCSHGDSCAICRGELD